MTPPRSETMRGQPRAGQIKIALFSSRCCRASLFVRCSIQIAHGRDDLVNGHFDFDLQCSAGSDSLTSPMISHRGCDGLMLNAGSRVRTVPRP